MRLRSFRNYTNVLPDDAAEYRPALLQAVHPKAPARGGAFFDFVRNSRAVQSTIVHFQVCQVQTRGQSRAVLPSGRASQLPNLL